MQKLSKINDRIWNYSGSYLTIWPKLQGQGCNCLMGGKERSHYKFQNCLLSVITPLKKMVKEDTRLAKMCENVSIALEEIKVCQKQGQEILHHGTTPHCFFFPPPMAIIWKGCLI
jgi:hypothetical protein